MSALEEGYVALGRGGPRCLWRAEACRLLEEGYVALGRGGGYTATGLQTQLYIEASGDRCAE